MSTPTTMARRHRRETKNEVQSELESLLQQEQEFPNWSLAIKKTEKKHKVKREQRQPCGFNRFSWSLQENIAYKQFLLRNFDMFEKGLQERRALKINIQLSMCVGTRSSTQCRSHHQKMIKCYRNIPSIIAYVQDLQEEQFFTLPKGTQELRSQEVSAAPLEMRTFQSLPSPTAASLWEFAGYGNWEGHLDF